MSAEPTMPLWPATKILASFIAGVSIDQSSYMAAEDGKAFTGDDFINALAFPFNDDAPYSGHALHEFPH